MYVFIEENMMRIQRHLHLFNFCCAGITILLFYMFSTDETVKQLKKTAGFFGNMASIMGGLALLYYVLREAFVKLKKRNIISDQIGGIIKKTIVILRSGHPVFGLLMLYFMVLHLALMILRGIDYNTSIFIFGMISSGVFVVMCFLGFNMKKQLLYRKYHRILAAFLVLSYLGHIFIKINL